MKSSSARLVALEANWEALGAEERDVLVELSYRLVKGQTTHGKLDLASDSRRWVDEGIEELLDFLVYRAIAAVQARVKHEA